MSYNDIDEVVSKLNSVIRLLNEKGIRIDELCTHWNIDYDGYGDLCCNTCGAVLQYDKEGDDD